MANYDSVVDGAKIVKTAIDTWGRVDIVINKSVGAWTGMHLLSVSVLMGVISAATCCGCQCWHSAQRVVREDDRTGLEASAASAS